MSSWIRSTTRMQWPVPLWTNIAPIIKKAPRGALFLLTFLDFADRVAGKADTKFVEGFAVYLR